MENFKNLPAAFLLSLLILTPALLLARNPAGSTVINPAYEDKLFFKNDSVPSGIRAILLEKSGKKGMVYDNVDYSPEFAVYTFDARTLAMHVDQAKWDKKLAIFPAGDIYEPSSEIPPLFNEYQYQNRPMYFDKDGNIYINAKSKWVKAPFALMKNMLKNTSWVVGSLFPGLKIPPGKVTYYGIDVSPDKYPILEWAFRYKVHYFEAVPELLKEITECRGEGGCIKYTAQSGKDKGSYVLFDNKGRLAEISSINSGKIVYVYGSFSVTIPGT